MCFQSGIWDKAVYKIRLHDMNIRHGVTVSQSFKGQETLVLYNVHSVYVAQVKYKMYLNFWNVFINGAQFSWALAHVEP